MATGSRTLTVTFIGNTGQLEQAMKRVGAQVNGLQSASRKMSSVGSTLSRNLTLPIVGIGLAAAKASMDFQAAMERVHTQAGASQKQVKALSAAVLNMAGSVATSPKELADGMYHVVSSLNATLPPAKRMSTELKVLRTAAEGAKVGNANLVDVTNALDAAIVSGIKGVQNYHQAMGALNAVVGAGDMTMQDLADALGTGLLAPMKTYGLTLNDVGGALAVFGDNNIRGADAATKLGSAVRIMAAPSKAASKALGEIGLNTLSLANDMRSGGLIKAFTDLQKHLKDSGKTASEQGLVITRAFGGRQSTGVQILLHQLDRLKSKTVEVGTGAKNFGRDWAATQQTAAFQTQKALQTMNADLTRFGQDVLPPLLKVGGEIVGDVDKVARAFQKLPKGAQDAIIKGGLLLAGVGPALKLLGVFTGGVSKLFAIAQIAGKLTGFASASKGVGALGKASSSVGEMTVGTLIAKNMVGGGGRAPIGGGAGPLATGAEGAAGVEAAAAARAARVTTGIVGLSALGVSGFAAMSHAQNTPLNKLNAFAHGVDPTAVLHLVGLPSVSDLLPAVKKARQVTASELALVGMGFNPASFARVTAGTGSAVHVGAFGAGGQAIPTSAGAVGAPAIHLPSLSAFQVDARNAQIVLDNLGKHSAKAFQEMAVQAAHVNDIKFTFADTLASELVKGKSVSSSGVLKIVHELDRLPPAAAGDAAKAMLQMTQQLESKGAIAHGSTVKLRQEIVGEFTTMGTTVAKKAAAMATAIQQGSKSSATSASRNFGNFEASVLSAMQSGVISTSKGTQLIAKALNSTLKAFGAKQIQGIAAVEAGALGGAAKSFLGATAFAQGGAVQFGQPGARGRDSIPVNFGGKPIMVGSGELGVVFTGRQQQLVNAALMAQGYRGLPGLFSSESTPHYMATGGVAGGVVLDPGVNMSVGQEPQILADLRKLSAELHNVVYVISGYRSPQHSVAVGGFANDPHTRGQAADIGIGGPSLASMLGVSESQLRAVGLYRPFYPADPHEVNHVQLLAGAALGGGGARGGLPVALPNIPAPLVKGAGTVADMVRAGLGKAASAANKYLAKRATAGSISAAGFSGGGSSSANEALGRRMMLAAGWGADQWPSLQALWTQESGWSTSALNPHSQAAGIPQELGHVPWQQFLAESAAQQIAWGLNYIRGRYGSPAAAEAHERANNWYARGGMISGFARGGPATKNLSSGISRHEEEAFRNLYQTTWGRLQGAGAVPPGEAEPKLRLVNATSMRYPAGMHIKGPQDVPYTSGHTMTFPEYAVLDALGKPGVSSRSHRFARMWMVHETAHAMQNALTLASERLREGGAQAWTDQFAPGVLGFPTGSMDANYHAFVEWVRKSKGRKWIDKGQFAGGGMIPFAGRFHDGGVIPGPVGKEQMALVQGGEVVAPMAKGGLTNKPPWFKYTPWGRFLATHPWLQSAPPNPLAGMATIPSQGTGAQIQAALIANALTVAQNSGSVPGQTGALNRQIAFDQKWLAADQAKLKKVNRALGKRGLTAKQRGQLLQDKLGLIQEVGSLQGDIGSSQSSLSGLSSSTDTGSTDTSQQTLIDATNSQTQEMAALRASLDAQTVYMKSVGEIEKRQAIKALSDVISGQIGGNFLSRSTGSAGDGSVARYGSVGRA